MQNKMRALDIIQLITNIAVIIGVFVAVVQIILYKRIAKMDFERRKKEATIAFAHEVLEIVKDLRQQIRIEYSNDPITYDEYAANMDIQGTIRQYLNTMERLAVGINSGVYDFDIYMRICGRSTMKFWEQLFDIVYERRRIKQCHTLYIEYEELVHRIRENYNAIEAHIGDIHENL